MNINIDKARGMLWGVICGDLLGVPIEFLNPAEREPVTEPRGGGMHRMPPGTWSDDTSLTLSLADSLRKGYNPEHIGDTFLAWYRDGLWSPHGVAFDIGLGTRMALETFANGFPAVKCGPAGEHNNGNGSLMRITPAAVYFSSLAIDEFLSLIHDISAITHGHPRSRMACGIYCLFLRDILHDTDPEAAWDSTCRTALLYYDQAPFRAELAVYQALLDSSLFELDHSMLRAGGYVVDTLNTAFYRLFRHYRTKIPWTDNRGITVKRELASTILGCVNHGGDPDTLGAVGGGLAGAVYGFKAIPSEWLEVIIKKNEIEELIEDFLSNIPQQ